MTRVASNFEISLSLLSTLKGLKQINPKVLVARPQWESKACNSSILGLRNTFLAGKKASLKSCWPLWLVVALPCLQIEQSERCKQHCWRLDGTFKLTPLQPLLEPLSSSLGEAADYSTRLYWDINNLAKGSSQGEEEESFPPSSLVEQQQLFIFFFRQI